MARTTASAVIMCCLFSTGGSASDPVPLHVAVKKGLVEVEVKGRGACTGDAVQVDVRRKGDREVHVVVESGTVMQSTSGNSQSMVCQGVKYERADDKYRRVDVMVLKDDQPHTFLVEGFCFDFHKATPAASSRFQVGTPDGPAARVIVKAKSAETSLRTTQVAVWLQRGVSDEDVRRRFTATEVEVKAARALVEAAAAAEAGNAAAERQAEQSVRALLDDLFSQLAKNRRELGYHRGDTIEVSAESAPVRAGRRTIGTAKKGDKFQVLAVQRDRVQVESQFDDGKSARRGWISQEHISLAEGAPRGAGRPVLRKLGELVSEADLEIITASERGM